MKNKFPTLQIELGRCRGLTLVSVFGFFDYYFKSVSVSAVEKPRLSVSVSVYTCAAHCCELVM